MNNNSNFNIPKNGISQNKLDDMLKMASQKLGTSPEKLRQQLMSGDINSLKSNPALKSVLNDPARMQQILQNPQVQNMLRNLNGKS